MTRVVVEQESPDRRPDCPAYRFLRLARHDVEAGILIPAETWRAFCEAYTTQWRYRSTEWQTQLRTWQAEQRQRERETWYARHYALLLEPADLAQSA